MNAPAATACRWVAIPCGYDGLHTGASHGGRLRVCRKACTRRGRVTVAGNARRVEHAPALHLSPEQLEPPWRLKALGELFLH
jgi:hypothetical protein